MKPDVTRWSRAVTNLIFAQLGKKCITIYGSRSYCFFFNLCKIVTTHASPLGIFVSPGATTPIGGCILQLSSGL